MSPQELTTHIDRALRATYETYQSLGKDGTEQVSKNQYGDTALRGDIACETTIIEYCRTHQLPLRILSEEHGITDITEEPTYLAVLDGIDGSLCYQQYFAGDTTARFGTLLTLFSSLDPHYLDYLYAGSMDHATSTLYYCHKGQGAHMTLINNEIALPIHTSSVDSFAPTNRIYVDDNPNAAHRETIRTEFVSLLSGYPLTCLFSSARYYADLASGAADLVLECTRKGNLEIAFGYALAREAGGVTLDLQGSELGPRSFLRYGQDEYLPTITASTYTLAKECINYLTEQRFRRSQ